MAGADGNVAIADSKDLHMTGAGTFAPGTGAVTLNGDTALNGDSTVASGKDFHMTGAGTFASGTGQVTLNGDVATAMART